jgi:hypothetical protein
LHRKIRVHRPPVVTSLQRDKGDTESAQLDAQRRGVHRLLAVGAASFIAITGMSTTLDHLPDEPMTPGQVATALESPTDANIPMTPVDDVLAFEPIADRLSDDDPESFSDSTPSSDEAGQQIEAVVGLGG